MLLVELTLISLIILTILTQDLTVRIYDKGAIRFSLSLTLFSLEFTPKEGKKRKKRKKSSLGSKISYYSLLAKLITRLAKDASIRVYKLSPFDDVSKSIPRLIGTAITVPMLLAYIYSIARDFETEDEGAIGEKIDIALDIPFLLLIISLIKLAYFKVKSRFA